MGKVLNMVTAGTVLGLAAFVGGQPGIYAAGLSAAQSAKTTEAAQNLLLTSSVRSALITAAASHYGLPASDFVGLGAAPPNYPAYYAYDKATSTYWAAASLVPKKSSYAAQVVVQDDGAYLIFHRTPPATWQAHDVGYTDTVGTCADYHVSIPAPVVAVWHWASGTCHPPAVTTNPGQPVLGSKAFIPRVGLGWGSYQPREIFNGGDPSGMVQRITWTYWGQPDAYGYGQTYIFKPKGGYYPGSVTAELRAYDLGRCTANGPLAYQHLDARVPSAPGGKLGQWFPWDNGKTLCQPYA